MGLSRTFSSTARVEMSDKLTRQIAGKEPSTACPYFTGGAASASLRPPSNEGGGLSYVSSFVVNNLGWSKSKYQSGPDRVDKHAPPVLGNRAISPLMLTVPCEPTEKGPTRWRVKLILRSKLSFGPHQDFYSDESSLFNRSRTPRCANRAAVMKSP